MPDWLKDAVAVSTPIAATSMAMRLAIAAVLGTVIAVTYRLSHGKGSRDSRSLVGTLVLLTILLGMVTMVIGDNVARAFGLVGALSIVRFRTVVEDTRDTAFVIFAVVVGMAVGTGLVQVAVIGVPFVAIAAMALAAMGPRPEAASVTAPVHLNTLCVRLGAGQPQEGVTGVLAARTSRWRLEGVTTARQGAALDMTFSVSLTDAATAPALVAEVNALPGVQSVDLRCADDDDD